MFKATQVIYQTQRALEASFDGQFCYICFERKQQDGRPAIYSFASLFTLPTLVWAVRDVSNTTHIFSLTLCDKPFGDVCVEIPHEL